MPHITLEYTDNIDIESPKALLHKLVDALVATGHARRKGIRARAIKLTDYVIADDDPNYHFMFVTLLLREGRDLETRKLMSESQMQLLETEFAHLNEGEKYLAVATNVIEMHADALNRHSLPVERIKD